MTDAVRRKSLSCGRKSGHWRKRSGRVRRAADGHLQVEESDSRNLEQWRELLEAQRPRGILFVAGIARPREPNLQLAGSQWPGVLHGRRPQVGRRSGNLQPGPQQPGQAHEREIAIERRRRLSHRDQGVRAPAILDKLREGRLALEDDPGGFRPGQRHIAHKLKRVAQALFAVDEEGPARLRRTIP